MKTREVAMKQSETFALMVALMKFTIFFFYSYALYVGSWFIENKVPNGDGVYNFQTVIQTVIALITGFVCLIAALPNVQAIVAATTLGALIFDVIEREPLVKNCSNPSTRISLKEAINFKNVTFKYPTSLPEHKPVLIDASFSIKAGQATAIVGPSGSGKSTIVQLIERFYDPRHGSVDFDGFDIKKLDLKSLRENIGYVS
jgi:ABC-type multidrug transport system fused ATPase/permease subunit